jgi:peptide/nickel transport system permease protein
MCAMDRKRWEYIISRGLEYALTFFLILAINFFFPHYPGGPLLISLGSQIVSAGGDR